MSDGKSDGPKTPRGAGPGRIPTPARGPSVLPVHSAAGGRARARVEGQAGRGGGTGAAPRPGNRAIGRLLGLSRRKPKAPTPPEAPALSNSHACEDEADRVASRAVDALHRPGAPPRPGALGASIGPAVGAGGPVAQLKGELGESGARAVGAGVSGARRGGRPLGKVGAQLASWLGADAAPVRIHTDARSNGLNRALRARAFTTGSDIFFRQGQYQPGTREGQSLLAHELAHVVQQHRGGAGLIQRKIGFEFQTCRSTGPKLYQDMDPQIADDFHGRYREATRRRFPTLYGALEGNRHDHEGQDTLGRDVWTQDEFLFGSLWRDHGVSLELPGTPDGVEFEVDKGDVEIKTPAFDETPAGHQALMTTMRDIVAYVGTLYGARQEVFLRKYRFRPPKGAQVAQHIEKGMYKEDVTFCGETGYEFGWKAIVWPAMVDDPLDFTAAMQATIGVPFEALGALVDAQIDSHEVARREGYDDGTAYSRANAPVFENGNIYLGQKTLRTKVGAKQTIYPRVRQVRANVDAWLAANVNDPQEALVLRGLLMMLAVRFAYAQEVRHQVVNLDQGRDLLKSYSKDYTVLMNRSTLAEAYDHLVAIGRLGGFAAASAHPENVFGPRFTRGALWLPTKPMTVGEYFDVISEGRSEGAATQDAALGLLMQGSNELADFGMQSAHDIGVGYADPLTRRDGLVVELRQLGQAGGTKMRDWLGAADAIFRATVFLNTAGGTGLDAGDTAVQGAAPQAAHPLMAPDPDQGIAGLLPAPELGLPRGSLIGDPVAPPAPAPAPAPALQIPPIPPIGGAPLAPPIGGALAPVPGIIPAPLPGGLLPGIVPAPLPGGIQPAPIPGIVPAPLPGGLQPAPLPFVPAPLPPGVMPVFGPPAPAPPWVPYMPGPYRVPHVPPLQAPPPMGPDAAMIIAHPYIGRMIDAVERWRVELQAAPSVRNRQAAEDRLEQRLKRIYVNTKGASAAVIGRAQARGCFGHVSVKHILGLA